MERHVSPNQKNIRNHTYTDSIKQHQTSKTMNLQNQNTDSRSGCGQQTFFHAYRNRSTCKLRETLHIRCQANICKRRNLRTSSAVGTANLWGSGFLCFSPKAFQAKNQASASFLSAWFATNVYLRQFLWKVH